MTRMSCASCNRLLTKPAAVYGGKLFGPRCAKAMGIVTIKTIAGSAQRTRAIACYLVEKQMDLFEEAT